MNAAVLRARTAPRLAVRTVLDGPPSDASRAGVARRGPGSCARGFTLVEMLVVLTIVAGVMATAVVGLGAITRTRLRSEAYRLAGVMRNAFDRALTSGMVVRIAVDLDEGSYQVAATRDAFTLVRDRPRGLFARDPEEEEERGEAAAPVGPQGLNLPALLDSEALRRFQAGQPWRGPRASFSEQVMGARKPDGARIRGVWTPREEQAAEQGTVYLYYFPHGHCDEAVVYVGEDRGEGEGDDRVYSLHQHPLSGKVRVENYRIDPWREAMGERDDLGKGVE